MVGNPEDDKHLHWRGMHFSLEGGQLVIHDVEKRLSVVILGKFSNEEIVVRRDSRGVTLSVARMR